MIRVALLLAILPGTVLADSLVTTRTLRAGALLGPGDIGIVAADNAGALRDPAAAIGQEARVVLYAGRPILARDIGPPAIVERNQIVPLLFRSGPLTITADGRALGRGGAGDHIRVMNLSSRNTVTGVISPDGTINISGGASPRAQR